MIPASLLAVAIHSPLNYDPLAIIGHDESVQIEIKAILHGGAIDLGDEPACVHAAEDRRFQLFVPFVLLRITSLL